MANPAPDELTNDSFNQSVSTIDTDFGDMPPNIHLHADRKLVFGNGRQSNAGTLQKDAVGLEAADWDDASFTSNDTPASHTSPGLKFRQDTVTTAAGPRSMTFLQSPAVRLLLQKLRRLEPNAQLRWFGRMKEQLSNLWTAAFVHSADQQLFRRAHCIGGYTPSKGAAVAMHTQVLVVYLTEKQTCWACILHREKCLKALRWQLREFANAQRAYAQIVAARSRPVIGVDQEWDTIRRGFRARVRTLLLSLLKLSIQFLEHVQQWRAALWRPQPFLFRGANYSKKIAFDTQWLQRENVQQLLKQINVPRDEIHICTLFSSSDIWLSDPSKAGPKHWTKSVLDATRTSNIPPDSTVLARISNALHQLSCERSKQRRYRQELQELQQKRMYIPTMRWRLQDPGDEDVRSRLFRKKAKAEKEANLRLQQIREERRSKRAADAARGSFANSSHQSSSAALWASIGDESSKSGNAASASDQGLGYEYYQEDHFAGPAETGQGASSGAAQTQTEPHWAGEQYMQYSDTANQDEFVSDEQHPSQPKGSVEVIGSQAEELPRAAVEPAEHFVTADAESDSEQDDVVPHHKPAKKRVPRKPPATPAPPAARAHRRVLSSDHMAGNSKAGSNGELGSLPVSDGHGEHQHSDEYAAGGRGARQHYDENAAGAGALHKH